MRLSDFRRRCNGLSLYFRRLPSGNAFRALLMHHAVIRRWLARPGVKTADEWVSAVLFWGLRTGGELVREYRRNTTSASIPCFSFRVDVRPRCSDRSVFRHVFIYATYAVRTPVCDDVRWIIDAGANVGYSALFLAGRYPKARILAIEPDAANFQQLLSNTRRCDRIKARHAALWHEKAPLAIADPKANTQAFHVRPDPRGAVEAVTIPGIMESENIRQIDILKMDIEGAEKGIFQNDCQPWLGRTRTLLVELHDQESWHHFERAIAPHSFERLLCGENVFLFRRDRQGGRPLPNAAPCGVETDKGTS
jgi:FkbM family methyltransferase